MKRIYVRILFVGLLSMLFFGSCTDESNSPTDPPSGDPPSGVVIIVDKDHVNAVPAPCGTEDAVCESITDGLFSAAMSQNGIPTVLVRPGIYDKEPAYPIQIPVPVVLKAEQVHEAIIAPDGAFVIAASNVTVEGFKIVSQSFEAVKILEGGHATLKNIYMEKPNQQLSYRRCSSVVINKGATAVIERSELYGEVASEGILTVNDSVISAYGSIICSSYGSIEIDGRDTLDNATLGILNNNTLYGKVEVYQGLKVEQKIELKGNTVYGVVDISGGKVNLDGNTFTEGISVNTDATINLSNNLIHNRKNYFGHRQALDLGNPSTASISSNRFDSDVDGIDIITCGETTPIKSDGTNRLLNPNCWIVCDGLPFAPGSDPF